MPVETFECEEVAEETIEMAAGAMELIESLGLEGQKKMLAKREGGEVTRCPYREFKPDELFVYRALCPQRTELKEFSGDAIPLRVLQVAAHAREHFEKLMVWHASSAVEKDPVLVGVRKHPSRSWEEQLFILSRWGEHLDEMPALIPRALKAWQSRMVAGLKTIQSKVATNLATVEHITDIESAIAVGHMEAPNYYGL